MNDDACKEIDKQIELCRQIGTLIFSLIPRGMSGSERKNLGIALCSVVIEHHESIVLLFKIRHFGSGYALMRPLLETSYKAVWVDSLATDIEVSDITKGRDRYPQFGDMVNRLEEAFANHAIGPIFGHIRKHLRPLHERTHTGADQITRRLNVKDPFRANYAVADIVSDLRVISAGSIFAARVACKDESFGHILDSFNRQYSQIATVQS